MTYQNILNSIINLSNQGASIKQKLDADIKIALATYQEEFSTDEVKRLTDNANAQLASLKNQAQETLDNGINSMQTELDNKYFANIEPAVASEIEMLQHTDLSSDELKGYVRKYQSNLPVLRRLEAIAKGKGYKIVGLTYSHELSFIEHFKKDTQVLVDQIPTNANTLTKISTNMLLDKVDQYNKKQAENVYRVEKAN